MLRDWMLRARALVRRGTVEREIDDELQFHLDRQTEVHLRRGVPRAEAVRRARVALGGHAQVTEEYRDALGVRLLGDVARDLRLGLRVLGRHRGFTVVAASALTIGVAANAFLFTFALGLSLPLPGTHEPDRLVRVFSHANSNVYYGDYLTFRDRTRTMSHLAALQSVGLTLRTDATPVFVPALLVSGNYFATVGRLATQGRTLLPADDHVGADGVVVISEGAWRRRFGADRAILSRRLTLNGRSFQVVGVVPDFLGGGLARPDVYLPWNAPGFGPSAEDVAARRGRSAQLVGRMVPGVSGETVQGELAAIAADLARTHPTTNRGRTVAVHPARILPHELEAPVRRFLLLLGVISGLVLLVTCLNIGSLLLARWMARRQEIGVRLALGAGRGRLVRQLLTEGLVLSSLACAAGVVVFTVAGRVLARTPIVVFPQSAPTIDVPLTAPTLLFAAGLAIMVTLVFGLLPALRASASPPLPLITSQVGGAPRTRLRAAFIIGQVAVSTLLLVLAGVLVRALASARSMDVGFEREGVVTATIDVTAREYTVAQGAAFYDRLLERLQNARHIESVSLAELVPLSLSSRSQFVRREGDVVPEDPRVAILANTNNVSRGYFRTMQIPMVAGRDFNAVDRAGSPDVAIVNQALAQRLWPGEDPIGRRFLVGAAPQEVRLEVVGVAQNAKYVSLMEEANRPAFYRPLSQRFAPSVTILARTAGPPLATVPAIRSHVTAVDPDLAVISPDTLEGATAFSVLPIQVAAGTAMALGLIALALAIVGTYGVTAYLARQRTREIGIRLALGASPAALMRQVMQQTVTWSLTGISVGLVLALAVTRLLGSLLFGIHPSDAVAFVGVALVLVLATSVACYVPGRRAARLAPVAALREG